MARIFFLLLLSRSGLEIMSEVGWWTGEVDGEGASTGEDGSRIDRTGDGPPCRSMILRLPFLG